MISSLKRSRSFRTVSQATDFDSHLQRYRRTSYQFRRSVSVSQMDEMDEDKKKKKGTISEDDISLLLPKYSAATIIAVLQEISQSTDVDMDWEALVKNTSTGVTNPREYQMLWRHLAYGQSLAEGIDGNSEVLDDDSDLEYELEPYPPATDDALNEAAACVKVLLASNLPNDSGPPNSSTVEAPLTINIPNGQASCAPSDNPQSSCPQGTNITVPVSVQKQSVATQTTTGGLDGNGLSSGSLPPRKKRKPWTPEEDMELIAAVEKLGERNWANILKGDFKGERTASQLSQRWAIIRKRRQTNSNPGGVTNFTGSQLSEAQLAARHALQAALDMPMIDSLSAACSVGVTPACNPSTSSAIPAAPPVFGAPMESSTKPTVGNSFSQAVLQNQQAPHQTTTSFQKGTSGTASQAVNQNQQAPHQTTTPFQKGTSSTASQVVHQNQQAPHQTTTSFQKGTSGTASQAVHQNQQVPHQTTTSFQKGTSGTAAKSRIITKKATPIPVKAALVGPNPLIQAAAVAAGARIITQTEASLLKNAQSKNAVHIRPGGGSLIKPSLPGSTKPLPPNPGTRSNVHYIRTGLTSASQPPPTFSTVVPSVPQSGCSQQAHGNSVGPAAVTCQVPSAVTASSSVAASFGASGVKSKDAVLTVGSGILSVEGVMKSVEEMKVDESTILSTQEVVKSVQKIKVDSSADVVKCSGQDEQADLPNSDMVIKKEVKTENVRNTSQEMEVDEKEQKPMVGKLTEKQPAVIEGLQDGTTMQKANSPCQDETTLMEASKPCQDVIVNENQNHCS